MEYSKTRKIFEKGYTCIQSTPITRTLATDSNFTLTRSNTNFCFCSDHFHFILSKLVAHFFFPNTPKILLVDTVARDNRFIRLTGD